MKSELIQIYNACQRAKAEIDKIPKFKIPGKEECIDKKAVMKSLFKIFDVVGKEVKNELKD